MREVAIWVLFIAAVLLACWAIGKSIGEWAARTAVELAREEKRKRAAEMQAEPKVKQRKIKTNNDTSD
jgi:hypothetical protein